MKCNMRLMVFWAFLTLYIPIELRAQEGADSQQRDLQITEEQYYIVQKGNTLFSIAKAHGLSVETLKSLNELRNNRIYPGQKLKVKSAANQQLIEPVDDYENSGFHTENKVEIQIIQNQSVSPQIIPATPRQSGYNPSSSTYSQSSPDNVPFSQAQEFASVPLTSLTSDITALFNRQKGRLHAEIDVLYLSENNLAQETVLSHIYKLGKNRTDRDLLIIYMTNPHLFDCLSFFPLLNTLKSKKFVVLDFAFSCQMPEELIKQWQKEHDLNIVMSYNVNPSEEGYWQSGKVLQALKEGLSGAADFNRDLLINVPELSFFLRDRVYDLSNRQQLSFIPFFPDNMTKLIYLK